MTAVHKLAALIMLSATPVFATESTCDAYLNAIASYLEYAAAASGQGDTCQTADYLEFALDASRDAQSYCTGAAKEVAESWSRKIPDQLSRADNLCAQQG